MYYAVERKQKTIIFLSVITFLFTSLSVQAALPKLKVSSNGHYIVQDDGRDTPFFWVGDTAWAIHNKYADENNNGIHDIDEYLANAETANFNVIQLMAINFWALDVANGLNRNGDAPFINDNPTMLNYPFWNNIASVIDKAEAKGLYTMLVVGAPMRKKEGLNFNIDTTTKAYEYGRQLGIRFRSKNSLIWSLGQDVNADDADVTTGIDGWRALAEGIADGVNGENNFNYSADYTTTFMTYHPGGYCLKSSSEWFHNDPWLDIHGQQTGGYIGSVDSLARGDYTLSSPKPVVNLEGTYEAKQRAKCDGTNSGSDADPYKVRRQAYHAITGGASGYTYGHSLIGQGGEWPAGAVCCNETGSNPPAGYTAPGRKQMKYFRDFFAHQKWWSYVPDQNIIASGLETGSVDGADVRKTAMKSSVGDEIIVYFPVNNQASINLNSITSASQAVAKWFDPRNGAYSTTGLASNYNTNALISFDPPSGFEDAVLVVQAQTTPDNTNEYEAESSSVTVDGAAYVRSKSAASGGQVVDYIGKGTGNYLQFNQVYAANAGDATVTFSYISGEERSAMISVNGGAYQSFTFANSGGWDELGTKDITLTLNAGQNTIRVTNDTWYAPMIDKIKMTGLPQTTPPGSEYESESSSAAVDGAADVRSKSAASGGQVVDYIGNGVSNYLQFHQVYVDEAGDATVRFFYISGEDRSAMISVNGGAYQSFTFANSGGWDELGTKDITLPLNAGQNTIRITNDTWYAPMIDKISLQ